MPILISREILERIKDELSSTKDSFLLVSAYCKLSLVEFFENCITDNSIKKTILLRFKPEDILSGASDLELVPYCRSHGWRVFFRLDLHAKTYIFDRLRCVIGSANATDSGMSIGHEGNYEMATVCELTDTDLKMVDKLLLGAVEITDDIYLIMSECVGDWSKHETTDNVWPETINQLFKPDYSVLFAEDFPQCAHYFEASEDDLLFLGLHEGVSVKEIKQTFCESKCYLWILDLLMQNERHELYFGSITSQLHSVLLDDPVPYRSEIKTLVSNMLTWIDELSIDWLKVDRPNHSQRLLYLG